MLSINGFQNNTTYKTKLSSNPQRNKEESIFDSEKLSFKGREKEAVKPKSGNNLGVILGAIGAIGLTLGLVLTKGKPVKSLLKKIQGEKVTPKITQSPAPPTKLKNINEAQEYFEGLGIKTIFKNGSEKHLEDINAIKDDLIILEKNGAPISKPNTIVFSDWHNKNEIEEIARSLNFTDDAVSDVVQTLNSHANMWGTINSFKPGQNVVFMNSSFPSNHKKFIHEMGHLHQDLQTSYWHSKGLLGSDFRRKQYEILGLNMPEGLASNNTYSSWSNQSLDDIFRTSCQGGAHTSVPSLKQKIQELFPDLNGNFETLFFAPTIKPNGKIEAHYINAKKMLEKLASESKVYAPDKTFENVAEIFQGLNQGRTYSDEVMLMYDFLGGGRVPNLTIQGKKYDDYIKSLYENKDLIQKLKNSLEIKKL